MDNITESDVNKIIRNLYSTNFFENVEISFSNNILKINLSEYPIVNQLIIVGEKKKGRIDQIRKLIRLKRKKSFIKSYLTKDVEIIKKLYASAGYNFSEVEAKINELENDRLDLVIEIDKGEKQKFRQ